MWKSSAGIYALKTSGEEEQGGLRLPLFRCGIIMMIKSQLQSYSKQWYAHSWGDSQSAGFPGSFFTLSYFQRWWCRMGHFVSQQRWAILPLARDGRERNWTNSMRISWLAVLNISLLAKHHWQNVLLDLFYMLPQFWLVEVLRLRGNTTRF